MFSPSVQPKTLEQINNIRESGKYLTELLGLLYNLCKPGISTMELELFAENYLLSHNLTGAFKGYNGFPANLCISNNDCVVHGIPGKEILQEGDLLKVDCGINYRGGISDAAFSIIIGGDDKNVSGAKLIQGTKFALDESIKVIKPGVIGKTFAKHMQNYLKEREITIIKNLTGHGVGTDVHELPHIYNRPQNSMKKWSFVEGMVCAIEPITSWHSDEYYERTGETRNLYTQEGDLGAQREYTLLVTEGGIEILAGLQNIPK